MHIVALSIPNSRDVIENDQKRFVGVTSKEAIGAKEIKVDKPGNQKKEKKDTLKRRRKVAAIQTTQIWVIRVRIYNLEGYS